VFGTEPAAPLWLGSALSNTAAPPLPVLLEGFACWVGLPALSPRMSFELDEQLASSSAANTTRVV
jgi:hypothetical protein